MPLRPPAGFIRPGYDPLKVPDAPTIGTATGGDAQASVAFTAPSNVGGSAVSAYYAVSNPDQITSSGASSPVTVTGLTNGTSYTFTVWALNTYGPSPYSAASGSVSPVAIRGIFAGGMQYNAGPGGSSPITNTIQFVSISTTGNASDFGDLTQSDNYALSACASSTRGIFAGGIAGGSTFQNVIQYITIASTGNATDFGDLLNAVYFLSGCNSSTRGVFGGGYDIDNSNIIDYITIASTGNATDFGDLLTAARSLASCSSATRGLFAGGFSTGYSNVIEYVTIASTGNSTDFGDLYTGLFAVTACSSSTRGLIAGGRDSTPIAVNVIQYVTIASTGNATDFGDLIYKLDALAACSNGNGGVQ